MGADDGLSDELLRWGASRKTGNHRDIEVLEREAGRRRTITMRKASNAERRTGPNTAEHPARRGLRGVDRRHRKIVP